MNHFHFFFHRNAEANFKSTKHHAQLPVKPSDCQLDLPIHARDPSRTLKPIVADDLHKQSLQFMDPLDDDTDPDVIPNQYGKYRSWNFKILF